MLERSSNLAKMETFPTALFWFIGIRGSKRTIVQDTRGSLIFEFMTMLQQASKLFIFDLVTKKSLYKTAATSIVSLIFASSSDMLERVHG